MIPAMAAPDRTQQQRMEALKRANEIRSYRSEVKRELRSGQTKIIDVLIEKDKRLRTMKVLELLMAVPGIGKVKAHQILTRTRISPAKNLGGLSPRQFNELCGIMNNRRPYRPR